MSRFIIVGIDCSWCEACEDLFPVDAIELIC